MFGIIALIEVATLLARVEGSWIFGGSRETRLVSPWIMAFAERRRLADRVHKAIFNRRQVNNLPYKKIGPFAWALSSCGSKGCRSCAARPGAMAASIPYFFGQWFFGM